MSPILNPNTVAARMDGSETLYNKALQKVCFVFGGLIDD